MCEVEHVQLSCMLLYFSSHPILSLPLSGINRPNKMVFKNRLIALQFYFCNCYMGNKWDEALHRERSMGNFIVLYCPLEEPWGRSTHVLSSHWRWFPLELQGFKENHWPRQINHDWCLNYSSEPNFLFFFPPPFYVSFHFKNSVMW